VNNKDSEIGFVYGQSRPAYYDLVRSVEF
jgi:hypothetical protein